MATKREGTEDTFNELVALLRRNEGDEKHAADVELDMRRLLMMARDAYLRDQLVRVQGVRRVTQIAQATSRVATQRICAGILGNLAHSERGRLSASSCDRWNCVSHRHQCPLSMLLRNTHASGDSELMRISAAALLAFSTQSQCQRHLDTLEGIPVLLRLLDVKQADGVASDVAIYAAATLWNICKAPALLLKLETIYGILRDQLTRKLSNLLVTPLEPFQLYLTPTGERGMPVLLEFDGENLNVLITASISTQLGVLLSIENYTGRVRSLADQFRPKTPPASAAATRNRVQGLQAGTSIAHYDESGLLASRTCAVCAKIIRVSRRSSRRQPSLLCSRDGCGQMFHLKCSRWARLSEDAIAIITAASGRLDAHFFCDACVLKTPLCYWDFLAAHAQHEQLLTENLFKSVGIARVPPTPPAMPTSKRSSSRSAEIEARESSQDQTESNKSVSDFNEEDRSPWPSVMLFDRNANLVGVGDKCFRISASSRDPEMYIVTVRYVLMRAYPATRQERAIPKIKDGGNNTDRPTVDKWEVSYAREGAPDIPFQPGNAVFWPALHTRDILALEYTRRTVEELEHAFLYEFQGEEPHDKTFSIGCGLLDKADPLTAVAAADSLSSSITSTQGLWMNLTPRKGISMKSLAARLGQLKRLHEVHILQPKKKDKPKGVRKLRKPHFPGQQLNKVAVDTT